MKKLIRSFYFAFSGVFILLKTERNFKIHVIAFLTVVLAGFIFKITSTEWLMLLSISALVLSLEALNTTLEKLCDLYSKEQNQTIKTIKDIAAGSVLIAAIFSVIVGVIIFWKYVILVFFA